MHSSRYHRFDMRRINRTVAWITLCALAWPSLGALPWLAQPAQAHAVARVHAHGSHPHQHVDPSQIPGSPTHPADHNCFECQVLQHLARCILAAPSAGVAAATIVCREAPPVPVTLPPTRAVVVVLPPVRAPPFSDT